MRPQAGIRGEQVIIQVQRRDDKGRALFKILLLCYYLSRGGVEVCVNCGRYHYVILITTYKNDDDNNNNNTSFFIIIIINNNNNKN